MTRLKAHKRRMTLLADIKHFFLIEFMVRILPNLLDLVSIPSNRQQDDIASQEEDLSYAGE